MIRVAITGIPGTGKSTVCTVLKERGYNCIHLDSAALEKECIDGETVDVDCIRQRVDGNHDFAESHYAHYSACRSVVILHCETSVILQRLKQRGYSESKINENIDAQNSDIIYQEALDLIPSVRIHRIDTSLISPGEIADRLIEILNNQQ